MVAKKGKGKKSKKAKEKRIKLECKECKSVNYFSQKNKINTPDRLEISKYCRHCHKHAQHKETK